MGFVRTRRPERGDLVPPLAGLLLAVGACADASAPAAPPDWIRARITEFEKLPVANPPREILRTTFAGRTVYYIPPTCCDIPSILLDESGQVICHPSGGFAGGDGRCPDFTLPGNAATIWRDSRVAKARAPASGLK